MFKLLLNLILLQTIAASVTCFTSKDVFDKGFTSYKNKVYDITKYVHPGGKNALLQCKGKPLEQFFDSGKYKFHITSSYDKTFNDLKSIYVGDLCTSPVTTISPPTTIPHPTTKLPTNITTSPTTVCYTSNDVFENGFVSYKNKVYDITNYDHPGGRNSLFTI